MPSNYLLVQNYPNPFNPTTTIKYNIPRVAHVQLVIYDMLGRQVSQLINERQSAGQHHVSWDSKDKFGNPVAAGLYFCRMEAEGFTDVIKLALVK